MLRSLRCSVNTGYYVVQKLEMFNNHWHWVVQELGMLNNHWYWVVQELEVFNNYLKEMICDAPQLDKIDGHLEWEQFRYFEDEYVRNY